MSQQILNFIGALFPIIIFIQLGWKREETQKGTRLENAFAIVPWKGLHRCHRENKKEKTIQMENYFVFNDQPLVHSSELMRRKATEVIIVQLAVTRSILRAAIYSNWNAENSPSQLDWGRDFCFVGSPRTRENTADINTKEEASPECTGPREDFWGWPWPCGPWLNRRSHWHICHGVHRRCTCHN